MDNQAPNVPQQQHIICRQYLFPILLLLLHGYYNFVRHDGWLNGAIGLLKETTTVVVIGQFCFSNYYASRDNKRYISERNVRQATHAANITGIVFVVFGLIWGCYLLTTTHGNDINDNQNAFNIMNNRVYLVALMAIAFSIQLYFLKPGISELQFFKYVLRYPWRFISPARYNKIFRGSDNSR